MPPISIMIKPVSGACNLQCRYCFYADEATHRQTLSYGVMQSETVRNLVRKAFIYSDDAISFTFQGGEPLLAGIEFFKSFVNCVSEYNTKRLQISFSVQTNGTLLDDEFCAFFAENNFLVGVSLDGTKEIHDSLRGNSYDDTMKGIRCLQKHSVEFNILCVLTNNIADNLQDVWKALAPFRYIQFIPCIDGFYGESYPYSLDAATYGKALVKIFDLYKTALYSGAPISERRIDNYLSLLAGFPPEHCGMSGECGMYFLCEADGSIFPCDFYVLDEWKLGNINETSFMRMDKGDIMSRFQSEGRQIPDECHNCKYFLFCRGGCRRDREPTLLTNRFCESYKYFFDKRLDDMKSLTMWLSR